MACGCTKGTAATPKVYIYVNPTTGTQTTYRTEYEAQAAVIRGGGSYRIEDAA